MRCPDCGNPLEYGRCVRCHPVPVVATVPATGLVDTHQVDDSGATPGESGPPSPRLMTIEQIADLAWKGYQSEATVAGLQAEIERLRAWQRSTQAEIRDVAEWIETDRKHPNFGLAGRLRRLLPEAEAQAAGEGA